MRATTINIKKSKEIVGYLEARAVEGERFTIPGLIAEFLQEPSSPYQYLQCKDRVQGWLYNVKKRLTNGYGLWFGNINDNGEYGIAATETEVRYAQGRYYSLAKGIVVRAIELRQNAQDKGLLGGEYYSNEIVEIPKLKAAEPVQEG